MRLHFQPRASEHVHLVHSVKLSFGAGILPRDGVLGWNPVDVYAREVGI